MDDQSPGPGREPGSDLAPESALARKPATPGHGWPPDGRTPSWVDWLFRDRETGRITVAQFPNVPLWIFLATVAGRWVVPSGSAVDAVGLAALTWWGLDEVLRGVNPWRRLLGLGGCAVAAAGLARLVR